MKRQCEAILAFDTSNYTTSIAVVTRENKIEIDERACLQVAKGERGLRQSHALFQHMDRLPGLIDSVFQQVDPSCIKGVAASDRPRPVEGSYMPVFRAGTSIGKAVASTLAVPFFSFSHQEGHLASAALGTEIETLDRYLAFHLSGGTCELLLVDNGIIECVGVSKDISFGQVIDRIGVAMGLPFPAGKELDEMASVEICQKPLLKDIPFHGLDTNLSGFETQAAKLWDTGSIKKEQLASQVFSTMVRGLAKWSERASTQLNCEHILYTGGVAESRVLREGLMEHMKTTQIKASFAAAGRSSDNGIGIGILGGRQRWR